MACRPSGKKGSKIVGFPGTSNYEWDKLIWIMYDENFTIQEATIWGVVDYRDAFDNMTRISPEGMRAGISLL